MMISQETIARVRDASDIVEIIGETVPHLKRAGKDYKGLCPFHQEKTPSFMVSPAKGIFHCFGCGVGGDVFKFVMVSERCTYPEAIRKLAERKGIAVETGGLSEEQYSRKVDRKKKLLQLLQRSARFYHKALLDSAEAQAARDYLLETRKLRPETIEKFQIGWASAAGSALCGNALKNGYSEEDLVDAGLAHGSQKFGRCADWFKSRVVFPIRDAKGQVIGFGGRILDLSRNGTTAPKYINSPETEIFQKGRNLYGFYHGSKAIRDKNEALIVEGYMDVIACHQAGVEYAVAPLGTSLTETQCQFLKRYADKVTLLFDSDKAGESAALRGLELLLEQGYLPMVARIPEEKDADEFLLKRSAAEFEEFLRRSASFVEFKIKSFYGRNPGVSETVNKVLAARELIPLFLKIRDSVAQMAMVRQAAPLLGVAPEQIFTELRKAKVQSVQRDQRRSAAAREEGSADPAAPAVPEVSEDDLRFKAELELVCAALESPGLRPPLLERAQAEKWITDPRLLDCLRVIKEGPLEEAGELLGRMDPAFAQWLRPRVLRHANETEASPQEVFNQILSRLEAVRKQEERKEIEKRIRENMDRGEKIPKELRSRYQELTKSLKGSQG